MLEYLGVSKRICLYLARISPQQTIDHLVYEISLQLHEEEGAAGGAAGPGGGLAHGQLMDACQQVLPPLQFADVLVNESSGEGCRVLGGTSVSAVCYMLCPLQLPNWLLQQAGCLQAVPLKRVHSCVPSPCCSFSGRAASVAGFCYSGVSTEGLVACLL